MSTILTKATVLASLLVMAESTTAKPINDVVADLLLQSHRVLAAKSDAKLSMDRVNETEKRAWGPELSVTAEVGQQHYDAETTVDPSFQGYDRLVLRAAQPIYDFGMNSAEISEARFVSQQSDALAISTTEGVLLDGLSAHWSVVRSRKVLDLAKQSEEKVRNQTSLESSMVELGKGYESNVLQAKVQLATAEARLNRAEGALEIASARVDAVFGSLASELTYDQVAVPKENMVPETLQQAKEIAQQHNKQLKVGIYRTKAINERIARVKAQEYRPSIQFIGEYARRDDMDGAAGTTEDAKIMLQLQYTFNAGMAGSSAVNAVMSEMIASQEREKETHDLVMEQITIAWRNLAVAKNNRKVLQNQVNIATHYLEMATAERQIGRRSLIDVLSAEMSLINAQSDLATTEVDEAIAKLTLLQAIGLLNIDSIEFRPL